MSHFKEYLRKAIQEQNQPASVVNIARDSAADRATDVPNPFPGDLWGPLEKPSKQPMPTGWPFDQPFCPLGPFGCPRPGCDEAEEGCSTAPFGEQAPCPSCEWECHDGWCGWYSNGMLFYWGDAYQYFCPPTECTDCPEGCWVWRREFYFVIWPEGWIYWPPGFGFGDGGYYTDGQGNYWYGGQWHTVPPEGLGGYEQQGGPPCGPFPGGPNGDCTLPNSPDGSPNEGDWPDDWPPNNDQYWCYTCDPPGWEDCGEYGPGCGLP